MLQRVFKGSSIINKRKIMAKERFFLAIIVLVLICPNLPVAVFAESKDSKYSVGEIVTVRIIQNTFNRKNPYNEVGRVFCCGRRDWGIIENDKLLKHGGTHNFEYGYEGIENNEIKISLNAGKVDYRYIRLPINEKKQATLEIITGQKLLITVIDEKNNISVEGYDEIGKLLKYPSPEIAE